jgi:hypothetical protein
MREQKVMIIVWSSVIGAILILGACGILYILRHDVAFAYKDELKILKYDSLVKELTIGNETYIQLGIPGELHEHAREMMTLYNDFQKRHPELKILNHWFDYEHSGEHVRPMIFGMWIEHVPCSCLTAQR